MKPELNERKGFVTQNFELDFSIELELRRVPTMNRTELVSFIELLVETNRKTYETLTEFQTIALEQSELIDRLVSIKEKLETTVAELDRYVFFLHTSESNQ